MTEPMGERGRQGAAPLGGHTPGPWTVSTDYLVAKSGNSVVAHAYNLADLRLIAAAPELLEALQECAADLAELAAVFGAKGNDTSDEQRHLEAADAAIAKARGEQ